MATETYTPDQLLVGDAPVQDKLLKMTSGATYALGLICKKVLAAAIAADGGNTGDGTAGDVTVGAAAKLGDYSLECVETATDAGRFKVIDPDGNRLDDLTVGTEYSNEHFTVTISDGASDFAEGDLFTVTISDSGEAAAWDDDNGNAPFAGVLTEEVDASSAAAYGTAYITGELREGALSVADGASLTAAVKDKLTKQGLYIKSAQ